MQRVLQVVNGMDRGGIETLLMNIYRKVDRKDIQFDFLTHPYNQNCKFEYENEIISMGGRIYKAPSFSRRPFIYKWYIKNFFANHPEYTVVHAHNLDLASLMYMREAKKMDRYLIAHSHNTNDRGGCLKRLILRESRLIIRGYPDFFYACSMPAAIFAFGKKIAASMNCEIFYNGIDVNKYVVDNIQHNAMRKKLFPDVKGPIFGTVGRLTAQKNHTFLLDIFKVILCREPSAILVIVGKGELRQVLEDKAKKLNIIRNVCFVGSVPNVPDYLKAFDVFLFPSAYEGLGMAAVEAQACGLPTLLSDAIPDLAACTDCAQIISLSASPDTWAKQALKAYQAGVGNRKDRVAQVRAAGFDIKQIANNLCTFYSLHADGR